MSFQEVPRSEWSRFLDGYSRAHEGWLCAIGESPYRPLVDVRTQNSTIAVTLGDHDVHTVRDAVRVCVDTDAQGADRGLRIEDADGQVTNMHFRVAALPESLDGLAPQAS